MKLLLLGDSFAADWTVKYKNVKGWPNLLADKFEVTNLAQAGVGEYKIYQQAISVQHVINTFDLVIISHTSPYRVNTRLHPIHHTDLLHKDADLMLTDVDYHYRTLKGFLNQSLRTAYNFFLYHFDEQYQETVYKLLRKEIGQVIGTVNCLVVDNFHVDPKFVVEPHILDCSQLQKQYPGLANHMSDIGNQHVYEEILDMITNFKNT